ncbi:MAG: DUF3054 domain-containing protein [Actinomycetota bacterium]|nr:DUF3054 domain-containing protein [Actinomycetota bacterium]
MRRVLAAVGDLVAVLVFVGIGRSAHGHVVDLAGMVSTAWPFVAGVAIGWMAAQAWRSPVGRRSGLTVWLCCVAVGMLLRVVAGQGTAAAFIAVALGFLGLELLGWRILAAALARRASRPLTSAS